VAVERPSVPFVTVPTTAGTSGEATANATLRSPQHGLKATIRSPHMLAAIALVDPLLTLACPPAVTASSGAPGQPRHRRPRRRRPAVRRPCAAPRVRARRRPRGARGDGPVRPLRRDRARYREAGAVHGLAGVIDGLVDAPHGAVCAALLGRWSRRTSALCASARPIRPRWAATPTSPGWSPAVGRQRWRTLWSGCARPSSPSTCRGSARRACRLGSTRRPPRRRRVPQHAGHPARLSQEELVEVLRAAS
jgi:hypothetical protein